MIICNSVVAIQEDEHVASKLIWHEQKIYRQGNKMFNTSMMKPHIWG